MAITPDDVRVIVPTTDASDETIQVHIDTAEVIVSENLAGSGLSTTRLDKIRVYLSAHFLTISEASGGGGGMLKSTKTGEATDEYFSATEIGGYGLAATAYGQQALVLDTTGSLANLTKAPGPSAEFRVV